MIKRHRVYHLLLNNSYKTLRQSALTAACKCTPVYTSKLVKKLLKKGIIAKHLKNSLILSNPVTLAFVLGYESVFSTPLLFKAPKFEDTMQVLNNTVYSLTLDSALELKNGRTPKTIQAYVLGKDLPTLFENFTRTTKDPDLIVYPTDQFKFLHQQIVNNVFLVSNWDLFVDFVSISRINTALSFAKEFKLFKTIQF